jgi:hypothetical protein
MSYQTYSEYLKTPEFIATVAAVRSRAKGVCEDCKKAVGVDPHHVRYCKWGQFDPPENLLLLCRRCHERRHTCQRCGFVALKAKHIKAGLSVCDQCKGANHGTH